MTTTDLLAAAHAQFDRNLAQVPEDAWDRPTPCAGWQVRDLVAHLVSAETMAVELLDGASTESARAIIGSVSTEGDLRAAYRAASARSLAAFDEPGALERTVHHPMGDVSGGQLRDFRIGDSTLHAWDLARAVELDETLDPELVSSVWQQLEPIAGILGSLGIFGGGPSGTVPDDADLQTRLLDLSGRRP